MRDWFDRKNSKTWYSQLMNPNNFGKKRVSNLISLGYTQSRNQKSNQENKKIKESDSEDEGKFFQLL